MSSTDERELIDVPQVGEDDFTHPNHVPRSLLTGVIQPRMEEIFELVRSRLEASGCYKAAGRRVILTGGASQMPGVRDLAQLLLDKQVRHGRPVRVEGLAESTGGPAFAVAAGLLLYPLQHFENPIVIDAPIESPGSLWGRVSHWLRENL
jgi:cell division protein FtsA